MVDKNTLNLRLEKEVANLYGCREEQVPKRAPKGKLFFIVTPNITKLNRKYLYHLQEVRPLSGSMTGRNPWPSTG